VRWNAERVFSPLIGMGEADAVLVFERAEAVRYIEYLKPDGLAIVDSERSCRSPSPRGGDLPDERGGGGGLPPGNQALLSGARRRDCPVGGQCRRRTLCCWGAVGLSGSTEETWLEVIAGRVPARYLELNRQAFLKGREAACSR